MLAFGVPPKREHAMRQTRFLLVLMAGLATAPAFAADAPQEPAMPAATDDPNLWLEDVTGEKPLAWVGEQNARTDAELASTPGFDALQG